MISPRDYFGRLEDFPHAALFEGAGPVWEALVRLGGYLRAAVGEADAHEAAGDDLKGLRVEEGLAASGGLFAAGRTIRIPQIDVLIEEGVRIEPGVVVKGPSVLCAGAELRHGAYLRGSCLIGPGAIVGHATEVKNSVFLNHAEAGHFAYVGDSLVGTDANLGAGTKLANLEFRTEEEKRSHSSGNVVIRVGAETIDTGLRKFGAVVGDDAEIGCNAVTSPGTLLGPGCWVLPNLNVSKGVYPPRHFLRGKAHRVDSVPRKK